MNCLFLLFRMKVKRVPIRYIKLYLIQMMYRFFIFKFVQTEECLVLQLLCPTERRQLYRITIYRRIIIRFSKNLCFELVNDLL